MTERELLSAIANKSEITDEMAKLAAEKIEKMDNANAKRRNTPSKKAIENEPLLAKIETELLNTTVGITAAEVAAVLETSVQKASFLLRTLVANGKAVATDVKVPKKGTQKSYTKVEADVEADAE